MDLWTVQPRRRRTPRVRPPSESVIASKFRRPIIVPTLSERLPLHIIQVILSKLPISQLLLCRLVCKDWNPLLLGLSSNSFLVCSDFYKLPSTRRRFSLHSVEYTCTPIQRINFSASFRFHPDWSDVSIANSCNGLLCITKLVNRAKNCAAVLNPITNEYFRLPGWEDLGEATIPHFYGYSKLYSYGLGFIPKTKQYKIARVTRPRTYQKFCLLDIFTFGKSIEWSHISCMPITIDRHGVYFNGALYWVGMNSENDAVICRLNLEDNKFETVSVWERGSEVSIGSFNGGLYATTISWGGDNKFEVWMMRSDSWIKEFVVTLPQFLTLQLIQAYEDGKILCLVPGLHFVLYNTKTGRTRTLNQSEGEINKKFKNVLRVHHIDVLNFDSLQEIFGGNNG